MADSITPDLIDAIATQHRTGRRLYIATTSLDTQTQVVWDMGALAQHTDRASRVLFTNILIASSSLPGVFPPVLLTFEHGGLAVSELHADGGTVANLLVVPQSLLSSPTPTVNGTHVFILLNSGTTPRFEVVPVDGLKLVARSVDTMLKSLLISQLTNVSLTASQGGLKLDVAQIPGEFDSNFLDFGQAHLQSLFAAGEQQGKAGTAFKSISASSTLCCQ